MPTDLVQSMRIDADDLPSEAIIFGRSTAMREVLGQIERIVHTDLPVLIRGESGTGKEIVAKFLHARSIRHDSPFVKVNCGAIPAGIFGDELLGYEKTGIDGALESNGGLIDAAAGGTLFLDEIGDMKWEMQTKLIDLLEDAHDSRNGGPGCGAKVRVVCSTNRDLEREVERRTFRQDLFYRIEVINLNLTPLRGRKEDIPLLCEHFLDKLAKKYGRAAPRLTPRALQVLKQWNWPGNLRELENRLARLIVLGEDRALEAEFGGRGAQARPDSKPAARRSRARDASRQAPAGVSRSALIRALLANRWDRRKAAEDLHMSYRSFLGKLREAGVPQRRRKLPGTELE